MLAKFWAKSGYSLGISLWVVFVFILAQIAVELGYVGTSMVIPAIDNINPAIFATLMAVLVYGLSIVALMGATFVFKTKKITRETFGLKRLVSWSDIGIGLLAILPYFILSASLVVVVSLVWHGFDAAQPQSIPFSNLQQRFELIVAFITLVILAPFAEEALFRGYLLGKVKEKINKWLAVVLTAIVFGLLHLPGEATDSGLTLQWAVVADTLSLGLILGSLRIFTGSIWAGVILHMLKNGIAFYFLFINPAMTGNL